MYRYLYRSLLALLLLLCSAPWALGAGTANGALTGRVLDPDGGLVARLETDVVLTDTVSGKKVLGRLSKDGSYTVQRVPAGTYDIDVTVPSRIYEHFHRTNVVIAAGPPQTLDLHIAWGMNLGTVGDDPLLQGADLRAKTRDIEGPVPRTSDGRPDLSGVWTNIGDGGPPPAMPMKPWAQKMFDELMAIKQDNPGGLLVCPRWPCHR